MTPHGPRGRAEQRLYQEQEVQIKVNRFEVIDHRADSKRIGRIVTIWEDVPFSVKLSMQDGERTLKVFLNTRTNI